MIKNTGQEGTNYIIHIILKPIIKITQHTSRQTVPTFMNLRHNLWQINAEISALIFNGVLDMKIYKNRLKSYLSAPLLSNSATRKLLSQGIYTLPSRPIKAGLVSLETIT